MKLFVGKDDVGVAASALKVRAMASCAGVQLEEVVTSSSQVKKLSPLEKLPVLESENGNIVGSYSSFRFVGSSTDAGTALFGKLPIEQGQIEDWIEFTKSEVDVLVAAATFPALKVSLGQGIKDAVATTVAIAARQELVTLTIRVIESHLKTRTFLVGESITAADIVLACSLSLAFQKVIETSRQRGVKNTIRWIQTVLAHEPVAAVVGDFKLCTDDPYAAAPSKTAPPPTKKKGKGGKTAEKKPAPSAPKGGPKSTGPVVTETSFKQLFKRSRLRAKEILYREDRGAGLIGQTVTVCGWSRTVRQQSKELAFMDLNDGSSFDNLQIVMNPTDTEGYAEVMSAGGVGASFQVEGTIVESPAAKQVVEVKASKVVVLGTVDADAYPLKKTSSKHSHSVEFLRQHAHLRPRTNLIGAVARVRSSLAFATHQFFAQRGFNYVHTPIVTASDCEGAGEMFQVTTMLPESASSPLPRVEKDDPRVAKGESKVGDLDYSKDFFERPSFLTVSGQLNVECYACALSDVYTFGPTFRAENSHTKRHLAEFWMIEPEICFATLKDDIDLAEDYVKYCVQYVKENCYNDLLFFNSRVEKGLLDRLDNILAEPFQRLTYTEAIDILNKPENLAKGNFEEKPDWGIDLGSEHERFLTEKVYGKPVVLTDYPADIKAFYMRQNPLDDKGRLTVQAMDILVPSIGELIGGSAREERLDLLNKRITDMGLKPEDFNWYCDLRRYGSVPHAGFGLGFERLVLFCTGVQNIRDVIPFPRYPGSCTF